MVTTQTNFIYWSIFVSLLQAILVAPSTAKEFKHEEIWQASKSYSFPQQGRLYLTLNDDRISGQINDIHASAKITGDGFDINFGKSVGRLKGRLLKSSEKIFAHWIQPRGKMRVFSPYASPVHFEKTLSGYEGEVKVVADQMTFYMLLDKKVKGKRQVSFINPEQNRGRFITSAELTIDKTRVELNGKLRWNSSDSLIGEGIYDEDNQVISLYIPLFGGSFDFSLADKHSHYWPKAGNKDYAYRRPGPHGSWPVASPKETGINEANLVNLVQWIIDNPPTRPQDPAIHALLVAHKGKLVLEEYFHGFDRDSMHDTRSASKSLTGSLIGLAQHAGVDIHLNDKLYTAVKNRYPELTPNRQKQNITLEHILTMSTGLDCDDNNNRSPGREDYLQEQTAEPDWFLYILQLKSIAKPGKVAAYCSGGINLAGAMLAEQSGFWVPDAIEQYFATPLAIDQYHINLMPEGKEAYSGGGARLRARDFLKLGQLMLQKGRWQGQTLIAPEYAAKAISPLQSMFEQDYGLGWWQKDFQVGGKTRKIIYAGGNGGQQIIIEPKSDLVVLFYGGAYSTPGTFYGRDYLVPEFILNAVNTN